MASQLALAGPAVGDPTAASPEPLAELFRAAPLHTRYAITSSNESLRLNSYTSCAALSIRERGSPHAGPRGVGPWEMTALSRPWPTACQGRPTGTGRGRH